MAKQNNSNRPWDDPEAQAVREKSEYADRISSFAQYMYKEYIEESDGERSLMICAADGTIGGGEQSAVVNIILGGKQPTLHALTTAMQQDGFREAFHMAHRLTADSDEARQSLTDARRRLRTLYGICAGLGLWAAFIVWLQVAGVSNWVTMVSNLFMVAFIAFWMLPPELRKQRRAVRRLEREHAQACESEAMRRIGKMLERIAHEADDDDED